MDILDRQAWDAFYEGHPGAHILQSGAWGDLKSRFSWRVLRVRVGDCGAQVLIKRLPLGFSIGYVPKGPLGQDWQGWISDIQEYLRGNGLQFLKIEPDCWEDDEHLERMPNAEWVVSSASIQPRRTIIIILEGGAEAVLARMKQKTRYNIRLSQKKGVEVRPSNDFDCFYDLMKITGQRDDFGIHKREYYTAIRDLFPNHMVQLFLASYQGEVLGGIMVFRHGSRAWYFYGASSNDSRNLMPTYLLQWHGILWAIESGCKTYDLWGIPDYDEQSLEHNFLERSDGLWGVYRFKRGFGGQVRRAASAVDIVYSRWRYRLYRLFRRISRTGA